MKRIWWDEREKELFIKQVIRLMNEHPAWSKLQTVKHVAAHAMSSGRQRKITTLAALPWLDDLLERVKKQMTPVEVKQEPLPPPPPPPSPSEVAAELPTNVVLMEAMARIIGFMEKTSRSCEDTSLAIMELATKPPIPKPLMYPKPALESIKTVEPERPTVVLIGLKGNQFNEIEREFRMRPVRFITMRHDDYNKILPDAMAYIMATSFVPHAWEEKLKPIRQTGKVYRVDGGVTAFKTQIRIILGVQNGKAS